VTFFFQNTPYAPGKRCSGQHQSQRHQ